MINYKVVKGDTLSSIAARFSTSISMLVRTNGIKDANKIQVGRNLIIPDAPKAGDLMLVSEEPLNQPEPFVPDTGSSIAPRPNAVLEPVVVTGVQSNFGDWFKAPKVYWLLAGVALILLTTDND